MKKTAQLTQFYPNQGFQECSFPYSQTSPSLCSHLMYMHDAPFNPVTHTPVKASLASWVSTHCILRSAHQLDRGYAQHPRERMLHQAQAVSHCHWGRSQQWESYLLLLCSPSKVLPSLTLLFRPNPSFMSKVSL